MSLKLQVIENKGRIYRACVSSLLVAVLAFPPNIFAEAITWNGGTGNYSDPANWTCAPSCTGSFPNNNLGQTFEAVINSGSGDSVLLNTPSVITSLGLGGTSAQTSTLTASGPTLTIGDQAPTNSVVLNVANGGVLNIKTGSSVTLELGSSGSGVVVDTEGKIEIGSGGSLVLHNDQPAGYSQVVNYGSIAVNSGATLSLSDGGSSSAFDIGSYSEIGSLTLAGGQIGGQAGTETLINSGYATGNGTITGLAGFANNGLLEASGGTLQVEAPLLNLGLVSVAEGATLDLSNGAWSNLNSGVLESGAYEVGNSATLKYQGNDLTEIGFDAVLSLGGSGQVVNTDHDAISGSLSTVNGVLLVTDGATLDLTQAFTNNGLVALGDPYSGAGGTLTASNGFTNSSTESSGGLCGCDGSAVPGWATLQMDGSTATITGLLSNVSSSTASYLNPLSEISLSNSYLSTDSLLNQATLTSAEGLDSSVYSPESSIYLENSTLSVSGNATNAALATNGDSYSSAYISLSGSAMTVGGSFTNTAGTTLNQASLYVYDNSTMSVGGLFSNLGGASVFVDFDASTGGSTINTNGGFLNSNSSVYLLDNSTLNASTAPAQIQNQLDGPDVYGFANRADDSNPLAHSALLQLGFERQPAFSENSGPLISDLELPPHNSTANITGGLLNSAVTSNGGSSDSTVNVDGVSTLNADFVINTATAQTGPEGDFDSASASINVRDNSAMNVTGSLFNGSYVLNGSQGNASAAIEALYGSSITVGGGVTNYNASMGAGFGSSINVNAGGFANTADDQNSTFGSGSALFKLDVFSGAYITGGLTNSATTLTNGFANAQVLVDGNSLLQADWLTNTAGGNPENTGFAHASVEISGGSTLSVTGNVLNTFTTPGADGFTEIKINAGTLTVGGTFTNTNAGLSMDDGSFGTVSGLFTNNVNSGVVLDGGSIVATADVPGGSTLNTTGFQNNGALFLLQDSTVNNKGIFNNTGFIDLMNGSTLTSGPLLGTPDGDGPPPLIQPGTLTNTGTIMTGGNGANIVNVTGDIFNTSPGVVNIEGFGDQLTASGQFSNSGAVTIAGASASVSAGSILNLSGGSIEVTGENANVTSTGTVSNSGLISMTGAGEKVTSEGDFTNTVKGTVTVGGSANWLKAEAKVTNNGAMSVADGSITANTLDQAGTLNVDAFGTVTVASKFKQTAGKTNVAENGILVADQIEISGGVLSGDGTIYGDVLVDGGTLAPGDPQSIDIVGNYEQTLAGILDLAFAAGDDYDQINVFSNPDNPLETGNVILGGTLDLTLMDGFGLGIDLNTVFHILSWTGLRLNGSAFDTFNNQTFSNGTQLLTFQQVYYEHGLDLNVIAVDVSETPEPSTVSMFLGVMLLLGGAEWMRRRRKASAVS